MHIFFSGIGGTGIGPLALIAREAGYKVSGSDKQHSNYIDYLKKHGIKDITIGQSLNDIERVHRKNPIDWYVYSSAVSIENPDAPELRFAREHGIRTTKRDELLNQIINDKKLNLIAVAGTHGKTTTTAMVIWLFKQLKLPISYSVGGKLGFGEMGEYSPRSRYFVYEADEFDRNFLAFHPHMSLITGIDWDHPDIYPTRKEYDDAFRQFLSQSDQAVMWQSDVEHLEYHLTPSTVMIDEDEADIDIELHLPGRVNRQNAWQVAWAIHRLTNEPMSKLIAYLNKFPGVTRRFEKITSHLYSDYAHTPPKIRGALGIAHEVAGSNVVVVYEGLHNTRQHFIKDELRDLFDGVKQLYIVPSYLAREDKSLELLTPEKLRDLLNPKMRERTIATKLDKQLKNAILSRIAVGDLVLCLSAGGGGSLDEWIRKEFKK